MPVSRMTDDDLMMEVERLRRMLTDEPPLEDMLSIWRGGVGFYRNALVPVKISVEPEALKSYSYLF
jgi:hypothetical protein